MSMKIAFLTQEDPFYVRLFFEEFFARSPGLDNVLAVYLAPPMGKRSLKALARQMYDFYGPLAFVRMGLRYVMYKLAARRLARRDSGRFYSVAQACRAYGVSCEHVANVNDPVFCAKLRALAPDVVVSVACPQIFKEPLIAIPRLGCINIHNAPLPRYRGMLPNFWQMYHGERTAGTTIHRINANIDEGAILMQSETPIGQGDTLDELICRTKRHGALMMIDALAALERGELRERSNVAAEGSYFSFPTRADVREFRRRGLRLI